VLEGLAMIAVIAAWWPLIFLGWTALGYRIPLYVGSLVVLAIVFWRRWSRLQEGFRESQKIIDQQHLLRHGPTPLLTLHAPPKPPTQEPGRTDIDDREDEQSGT